MSIRSAIVKNLIAENGELLHMLKHAINGLRDLEQVTSVATARRCAWMTLEAVAIISQKQEMIARMMNTEPIRPTLFERLFGGEPVHNYKEIKASVSKQDHK